MYLNGASPVAICKQGCWMFLMYIHEQISAVSTGLSTLMSHNIGWHNIAGPALLDDPKED